MQGCRRSWEDQLKCVKILSVKGHNSAKICRTWIIFPHALLDLWYNICTKFHSNPCKDVGGVEKTNSDGTEWRNDGRTEGRNDGRTDKANTKCPLAILWRGHKNNLNRTTSELDLCSLVTHYWGIILQKIIRPHPNSNSTCLSSRHIYIPNFNSKLDKACL